MTTGGQNDVSFYIVDEELALLSPAAKQSWSSRIKKEALTAYETPAQIDARMKAVNYRKYPGLQKEIDGYVDQFKSGSAPAHITFTNFPEEAIDTFLFSIGASGISALIHVYLSQPILQNDEQTMEAVAALSRARHAILEKNSAVFS
jgi:hypothetical protein